MKRIDRLLLKIQEAQRLDSLQLGVSLVGYRPETGKWEVHADLWDGKFGGQIQRITMECNSQEEALKAVEDIETIHKPTGNRIKPSEGSVCILDDIGWAE